MEAVAEGEMCREQALLLAVGELVDRGRCDRCCASPKRKDWSRQATTLLTHLNNFFAAPVAKLMSTWLSMKKKRGIAGPGWPGALFRKSSSARAMTASSVCSCGRVVGDTWSAPGLDFRRFKL